jgi:acetoin utilization deacetylase AcuC-like enzyme
MKVAYSPIYSYQKLPEGHRFPMEKYDLLPQQLMHEGTLDLSDFFHPKPLTEEQILRTHSFEYWEKLKTGNLSRSEIRALGFPFHETLVTRGRHISGGTLECAYHAIKDGVSLNIAGGTHHAFADRGEGFCLFNDFAIASNELLHTGAVKQIMIIDLDVHQGNGTDKKIFNEIKQQYLTDKWLNSSFDNQIKEIAHNIRTIRNNQKLKQKKPYPKNQISLLNTALFYNKNSS